MSNNHKPGNRLPPQNPSPGNQVQVIEGNIPLLTLQLLSDINTKLGQILVALEKQNG